MAGHALVVVLLQQALWRAAPERGVAPAAKVVTLSLPPPPPQAQPPAPRREPALAVRPMPVRPPAPATIQPDEEDTRRRAPPLAVPLHLPATPPEPAEPPASAPLDLRWRPGPATRAPATGRGSAADLAREDGRSNTRPPSGRAGSLEAAPGGDPQRMVETDLGQGSRRIERGQGCVLVHESRSAALDPMSGATRPQPRVAEPCR